MSIQVKSGGGQTTWDKSVARPRNSKGTPAEIKGCPEVSRRRTKASVAATKKRGNKDTQGQGSGLESKPWQGFGVLFHAGVWGHGTQLGSGAGGGAVLMWDKRAPTSEP